MNSLPVTKSSSRGAYIYVNVPFCKYRCPFCMFTSGFNGDDMTNLSLLSPFFNTLLSEINDTDISTYKIKGLVFGGGTPTLLGSARIAKIVELIRSKNNSVGDALFISVEVQPEFCNHRLMKNLYEIGTSRLSFGVQSFDDEALKRLGRRHSSQDASSAIKAAQDVGFKNINIDLLCGYPGQRASTVETDIETAVACNVQHVCLNSFDKGYNGYEQWLSDITSTTPTMHECTKDEQIQLYERGYELLHSHGFERYNCFNFCQDGFEYGYEIAVFEWQEDVVGFGPGSISYHGPITSLSTLDISGYMNGGKQKKSRRAGGFDYIRLTLHSRDGIRREYFNNLFQVSLDEFVSSDERAQMLLDHLDKRDLIKDDGKSIRISERKTPEGFVSLREFDQILFERKRSSAI